MFRSYFFQIMTYLARYINKISKNLIIFSTPAALLLGADPAKADININMFDEGSNLKVVTSGSLSELGSQRNGFTCGSAGVLYLIDGIICTGPDEDRARSYAINGPTRLSESADVFYSSPYPNVSGLTFNIWGAAQEYVIDPDYTLGQPFLGSATFSNTSLADLGFTTPGLVATWTINGTSESIKLFVGQEVPGPLPLLGAGAAFGWSRRLRRRISTPWITPPQA